MNYAQMRKYDTANGPGIRSTLFVSGCTHHCPGCFNQDFQKFNYGQKWTDDAADAFIDMISDPQIKGITILGGEPMDQVHDDDLLNLVRRIKKEIGKDLWIYSGYTFEQIIAHEKRKKILSFCDVLVDGLFVEELKDLRLKFRGSSNQRIVDVRASLETGNVTLMTEFN